MIEIDESEFPLIVVTFRGQATSEDWDALKRVTTKHFEAEQRFAMAVRTLDFKLPEVRLLKDMGAWTRDQSEAIGRHLVRSSLCIPSAVARGAVNFINRVAGSPVEQGVFADWEETVAWARAGLESQGAVSQR